MPDRLTPAQARKKNRPAFDQFWAAFPKKVAPTEAERVFTDLVERGADPEHLIKKARAYAATVDPADMRYVPSPHSWLKQGRYDDADLFTNQVEAEKEWFRQCWRDVNVKAVENRYHVTYEKQYPPDEMSDTAAIAFWYKEKARQWIAQVCEEVLRCREKNQPTISSQSSLSSEPCSTTLEFSQS